MKSITHLNNTERVKLMAQLFPHYKVDICKMIIDVSNMIEANKSKLAAEWDNGMISFKYWYQLSIDAARIVIKYNGGERLKTPGLFSDQLADGMLALFTIHCIAEFAKQCEDKKFKGLVTCLFEY